MARTGGDVIADGVRVPVLPDGKDAVEVRVQDRRLVAVSAHGQDQLVVGHLGAVAGDDLPLRAVDPRHLLVLVDLDGPVGVPGGLVDLQVMSTETGGEDFWKPDPRVVLEGLPAVDLDLELLRVGLELAQAGSRHDPGDPVAHDDDPHGSAHGADLSMPADRAWRGDRGACRLPRR